MSKLSTIQAELLTAAARSDDGTTMASADAKSAVAGLIKWGFFISTPQPDGPSRLLITQAGRSAIDAAEEAAGETNAVEKTSRNAPRPPAKPARQQAEAPKSAKLAGKIGVLVGLLRRPEGATVGAMMAATGWQAHSVRGAMSGAVKKSLGLNIASEKTDGGRVYRIADEAKA